MKPISLTELFSLRIYWHMAQVEFYGTKVFGSA